MEKLKILKNYALLCVTLLFLISCSKSNASNNNQSSNNQEGKNVSISGSLALKNFLKLSKVSGEVYIRRGNEQFRGTSDIALEVNDTIVTGARGFVTLIALPENSVINIMANSRFSVKNFLKESINSKSFYEFDFKRGKVISYINNKLKKTDVKIISGNSIVGIRGTVFMLEREGNKNLVALKKGTLNIYNKNNPNENFILEENKYAVLSDTKFNNYKTYNNLDALGLDYEIEVMLDGLSNLEESNLQANADNSPKNQVVNAETKISHQGKGTIEDPFIINNNEKLQAVGSPKNLSKHFKLGANLDLKGSGFTPIGSSSQPFTGTFDGNGFIIKNLTINTDSLKLDQKDEISIGLFSFAGKNSIIRNVKLENVNIKSDYNRTGALVGVNNGSVLDSFVSGVITGPNDIGGLVGYNHNQGQVMGSLSKARVNGDSQIGGLVGYNGYGGYIKNSYSQGKIEGDNRIGGLIGINDNAGKVESSYSISQVSGREEVGGLIGYANKAGSAVNAFWDTEVSAITKSSGGTGRRTKFIQSEKVISHFGLDEKVWKIQENNYPKLLWE